MSIFYIVAVALHILPNIQLLASAATNDTSIRTREGKLTLTQNRDKPVLVAGAHGAELEGKVVGAAGRAAFTRRLGFHYGGGGHCGVDVDIMLFSWIGTRDSLSKISVCNVFCFAFGMGRKREIRKSL